MKNESIRKTINVDKPNYAPLWTFKQEDDAVLRLSLFKGSTSLDITGQTVKLGVLRADKTLVELEEQSNFTINKNELDITLKNNILSVSGKAECDLQLIDASGKMTTASFFIEVNKKATGITNILGTNLIEGLEKLKNEFKSTGDKLISAFSKEYDSLKRIIIDENQAANLQDQVNQTNAHLDNIETEIEENKTLTDSEISKLKEIANTWETFKNTGGAIGGNVKFNNNIEITDNIIQSNLSELALNDNNNYGYATVILKNKGQGIGEFTAREGQNIDLGSPSVGFQNVYIQGLSKDVNGYTKLPNGLIMQWGQIDITISNANNGAITATLPIAFSTSVRSFGAICSGNSFGWGNSDIIVGNAGCSNNDIRWSCSTRNGSNVNGKAQVTWWVLGY